MKSILYMADMLKTRLMAESGLTWTEYQAMQALSTAGGSCTTLELGTRLELAASTTTHLCDRLVRAGRISRERTHPDRRVVMVRLVDKASLAKADAFLESIEVPDAVTDFFMDATARLKPWKSIREPVTVEHIPTPSASL